MPWPNPSQGQLLTFYVRNGPRTYDSADKVPADVWELERGGFVTVVYAGRYGNVFVEPTKEGYAACGVTRRDVE